MKLKLISMLVVLAAQSHADIPRGYAQRMADAIYKAEGAHRARVPYGILSVKVRDKEHARQVCLRTIENNYKRWEKAGRPGLFVDYLADRYCPASADPIGNRNWKKNVRSLCE